jgi:hypothetical protein
MHILILQGLTQSPLKFQHFLERPFVTCHCLNVTLRQFPTTMTMGDLRNDASTDDQDWELQFLDGGGIDDDLAQYREVLLRCQSGVLWCREAQRNSSVRLVVGMFEEARVPEIGLWFFRMSSL